MSAWIHTFNGHEVDLINPKVDTVDAIDIAHSLSQLIRFTGHCTQPYSVGQHSVVGSVLAEVIYPEVKWLPQEFLLHDSPEAYVGDVSSPLKSILPGYREIEDKHRKAIELKFCVSLGSAWEKKVDLRMLATEQYLYMPEQVTPWDLKEDPFIFEEFYLAFKALDNSRGRAETPVGAIELFWDSLWEVWSPERTEHTFLSRMEKLGL